VELQRRNTSIEQTIDPNATSPVIEFWEWVLRSASPHSWWSPRGGENDSDASPPRSFVCAGEECSGFPRASTTWALWTGTWSCVCSSPGSCATSASGRGWNPQERWVTLWPFLLTVDHCKDDIWYLFVLFGMSLYSSVTAPLPPRHPRWMDGCFFNCLHPASTLYACVCIGGLLHGDLPLSDADCAVDQGAHPARCWDRHPVLPLSRPGTPARPSGTTMSPTEHT